MPRYNKDRLSFGENSHNSINSDNCCSPLTVNLSFLTAKHDVSQNRVYFIGFYTEDNDFVLCLWPSRSRAHHHTVPVLANAVLPAFSLRFKTYSAQRPFNLIAVLLHSKMSNDRSFIVLSSFYLLLRTVIRIKKEKRNFLIL